MAAVLVEHNFALMQHKTMYLLGNKYFTLDRRNENQSMMFTAKQSLHSRMHLYPLWMGTLRRRSITASCAPSFQFGKAIIEFQNTQFKLADMLTSIEASRAMVANAAGALDAKAPRASAVCAMAKKYVLSPPWCHFLA